MRFIKKNTLDDAACSTRILKQADIKDVMRLQKDSGLSHWSFEDYQKHIANENSINLAAVTKSKFVGFIICRLTNLNKTDNFETQICKNRKSNDDAIPEAEIFNIAVDENFQRERIGTLLIKKLIELCRKQMVGSVWLEVRFSNFKALNFYGFHGFEIVYSRKNYYHHPLEEALVMKLDLVDVKQK